MPEPPRKKQRAEELSPYPQMNRLLVEALESSYRAGGCATRAAGQSKYLRNQFPCFGLTKPERVELEKPILQEHPITTAAELKDTVHHLWSLDHRDFQYAGQMLWVKYHKLWTPDFLDDFKQCVENKSWWDTVDMLGSNCVGKLIEKFPELQEKMEDWIEDPNMWTRRVAIIHQLKYKEKTNENLLFEFCEKRADEKDFFIRKAIGWALREYSKTNAEVVRKFIEEHREELSPLSIREGSKYC